MSALSRELCDEIPTRACHEMWNNGALFAETAQKVILGKYFFSALSCTHNKVPSFLAMARISELN